MHLSFQSLTGTGLSVATSAGEALLGRTAGGARSYWWRHPLQPAVSRGRRLIASVWPVFRPRNANGVWGRSLRPVKPTRPGAPSLSRTTTEEAA